MSAHPLFRPAPVTAAPGAAVTGKDAGGLLLPIGGGDYAPTMGGLAAALFDRRRGEQVKLVLLPPSYSSDPCTISAEERAANLLGAERRRLELERSLQALAPAGIRCTAVVAPVCTREDALDPCTLAHFGPDLDAAFLLGGDQAIAMRVLVGTPVEAALCALHRRGGVIAGSSAGAAMQSRAMLAGYCDGVDAPHPFAYGATALWDGGDGRGLACGQAGVVIDQHFFQRGRLPRLLETVLRPGSPRIGVGIDAYTGLHMQEAACAPHGGSRGEAGGGWLGDVFGLYAVAVLDVASLGAAEGVRYCGPQRTVSVRNVLVHLLAPGPYAYDLEARRHSLAPALTRAQLAAHRAQRAAIRPGGPLAAPAGAGLLLLSGEAGQPPGGGPPGGSTVGPTSWRWASESPTSETPALRFLAGAAASPAALAAGRAGASLLVAALDAAAEPAAQLCAAFLARALQAQAHASQQSPDREGGDGSLTVSEAAPALTDAGVRGDGSLVEAVEYVCGGDALAGRLRQAPLLGGIVVIGNEEGGSLAPGLAAVAAAWRDGAALWLMGAAAGAAGCQRGGPLPPVHESEPEQMAQRRAPRPGITPVFDGLDLLPATIEPRALEDSRWGRVIALACACSAEPVLGLSAGATLAIDAAGATVLGEGSLFVLDLSLAERRTGENGAYVIANGLLDVYAAGEKMSG